MPRLIPLWVSNSAITYLFAARGNLLPLKMLQNDPLALPEVPP